MPLVDGFSEAEASLGPGLRAGGTLQPESKEGKLDILDTHPLQHAALSGLGSKAASLLLTARVCTPTSKTFLGIEWPWEEAHGPTLLGQHPLSLCSFLPLSHIRASACPFSL